MGTCQNNGLWLHVPFLCNEAVTGHANQSACPQLLSTHKNCHPIKDHDLKLWCQSWNAQHEMYLCNLLRWEYMLRSAVIFVTCFPSTEQCSSIRVNH